MLRDVLFKYITITVNTFFEPRPPKGIKGSVSDTNELLIFSD